MSPTTFWICAGIAVTLLSWQIIRIARRASARRSQALESRGFDLVLNDMFTREINRVLRRLWTRRPVRDSVVSYHSYTADTQLLCLMLEDESSFNAVVADDWSRAQMSFMRFGSTNSGPAGYWTTDPTVLRCLQNLFSFLDELPKHQTQRWRRRA